MIGIAASPDGRRLEISILVSTILWIVLFFIFSLITITGPQVPEDSMNPLYIELAQVEPVEIPPPEREERVGGELHSNAEAERSATEAASSAMSPAAPASPSPTPPPALREAITPVASTPRAVPVPEPAPPSLPLRADPGDTVPAPRTAPRNTPFQGGSDPFAPLSESALASELPDVPRVDQPSSSRPGQDAAVPESSTAGNSAASAQDPFARTLSDAEARLSSPAPLDSGADGIPTVSGPAGSSAKGDFDFGDGVVRKLFSSQDIRIPPSLLEGQPRNLSSVVSFKIDRGGTVLVTSIRFKPSLPMNIEDYLRNAFSQWVFSPANSDGQVSFTYSIKVR